MDRKFKAFGVLARACCRAWMVKARYKVVSAICYEGTPVQEKAVAFPTDVKLIHRARETLVRLARERGVPLRAISPSPLWVQAV